MILVISFAQDRPFPLYIFILDILYAVNNMNAFIQTPVRDLHLVVILKSGSQIFSYVNLEN